VTFCTWQHRQLFPVEIYARLFLKTLYHYRRDGHFLLHAFALMPDHVHLLITPSRDVTLERAVQLIKGGYSHALGAIRGRKGEVWQRGFTDHRIRDSEDFAQHRNYIHQNPVRAHIIVASSEYRYCSSFPGFKLDTWPPAAEAAIEQAPIGTSGTRALPGSAGSIDMSGTRALPESADSIGASETRALPGSAGSIGASETRALPESADSIDPSETRAVPGSTRASPDSQ
jgi:putative transposase